ncbi:MAG: hypothetical protein ACR2GY_10615 [Phycisphaerales bacterium]
MMMPLQPESDLDPATTHATTNTLQRVVSGTLAFAMVSAGLAGLVLCALVLPWTAESWAKQGWTVEGLPGMLLKWRRLLLLVIAALLTLGIVCGFTLRRSPGTRIIALLVIAGTLSVIAVAGVIGWWMLYADAINRQMSI